MPKVEIFGFSQSTYVQTIILVCEEKQADFSIVPLEFREESHRQVHPYLKMPALRHGDVQLFESLAIATYLNAALPGPDLEPASIVARARMLQWISAANSYVYDGVVGRIAKSDAPVADIDEEANALLRPFDEALAQHAFLAGDMMTLADLFLLPMLKYARDTIGNDDWLESTPNIVRWIHSLESRQSRTGETS